MWASNPIFCYDKEPSRDILCLDCKSFYASVEAIDLGLDPLTCKLVVMSYPFGQDNKSRGSGLILASSPAAKAAYHINNVSRARDLPYPYPSDLYIVPPRMRRYMQMQAAINRIYLNYADMNNHAVYSIDESFLDVTGSLKLFKVDSAYQLAKQIRQAVRQQTGIVLTIGIGDNPLLAKLALDNAAKSSPDFIAEWRYEDVPQTLWQIEDLTKVWGIGRRTARKLQGLGIENLYDLAHSPYYLLKDKFGVLGEQLYAHAWGIDRSFIGEKYQSREHSIGNSQVLPEDYTSQAAIELVIAEMADQVGTRLRRQRVKASMLSLGIGYSMGYVDHKGKTHFHKQTKIKPSNNSREMCQVLLYLFRQQYEGQIVRHISITGGKLVPDQGQALNLLVDYKRQEKLRRVDFIVDEIRQRYGYKSIVNAQSLLTGGRAIARSQLVGGHAGGLAGIEGVGHGQAYKKRIP